MKMLMVQLRCKFSLAHFCEIHGPTSILCTQLLFPTSCQQCGSGSSSAFTTDLLQSDYSPPGSAPASSPPSLVGSTRDLCSKLQACSTGASTPSSSNGSPAGTPPLSPKSSYATPSSSTTSC